jgi:hypothetical protein
MKSERLPGSEKEDLKTVFTLALRPTFTARRYYSVDEANISQKLLVALRKEYGVVEKAFHVPSASKVSLFAITSGEETYLLPDFFHITDPTTGKIDAKAQGAVLLHEALRYLFDPSLKTEDIVAIEIGYEKFLKETNDVAIYYELNRVLHTSMTSLVAAYYRQDLKDGAIRDLVNADGDFNWTAIAGAPKQMGPKYNLYGASANDGASSLGLSDLINSHEKSLFLSWLATAGAIVLSPDHILDISEFSGRGYSEAQAYIGSFPDGAQWIQLDDPEHFMSTRHNFTANIEKISCFENAYLNTVVVIDGYAFMCPTQRKQFQIPLSLKVDLSSPSWSGKAIEEAIADSIIETN